MTDNKPSLNHLESTQKHEPSACPEGGRKLAEQAPACKDSPAPLDQTDKEEENVSRMKKRMDSFSPSICLAKWLWTKIHLATGKTQSCYHVPAHFADKTEIAQRPSALHNTGQKKWERELMLNGKRPPGCSYCWRIEDSGKHYSDRYRHSMSLEEPRRRLEEFVHKGSGYEVSPSYLELNMSNVCNLKCSYCSPEYSSSWEKELKEHGSYPTEPASYDIKYYQKEGSLPEGGEKENPYEEAFWKWFPELYPGLQTIRLTGGEPLIDLRTFKILDYIESRPRPDLELALTSNLCPPLKLRERFLKQAKRLVKEGKIKKLTLFASIDNWGPQAEYIRYGLNLRQFEENIRIFRKDIGVRICLIATVNALSVFSMKTLLEKILEWRELLNDSSGRRSGLSCHQISADFPYLRHPLYMSLEVLPLDLAGSYLNEAVDFVRSRLCKIYTRPYRVHGFSFDQMNGIARLLDVIRRPLPENELRMRRINFYKFFSEHDRRRQTDIVQTFPELSEFWKHCRTLAEEYDEKTAFPKPLLKSRA